MRLCFILHGYPPAHNAGAEWMAHRMFSWFAQRGHDCVVVSKMEAGDVDEVEVRPYSLDTVRASVADSDVVFTHLNETRTAEQVARTYGKPLVHVIHNERTLGVYRVTYASVVVANSAWVLRAGVPNNLRRVPAMVVHPLVPIPKYQILESRKYVTLVNLMARKGAPLFYQLARQMPERRFLGVTGAYGTQTPGPSLPNLDLVPNSPDMEPVWAETGVLVVPSAYESFGMAAMEAAARRIPVIAAPTPGLVESLGEAGIFWGTGDYRLWVTAIRALDNPTYRCSVADAQRTRAVKMHGRTVGQMLRLEATLAHL